MTVYIAGPVSGISNFKDAFIEAQNAIHAKGHETMSLLDCSVLERESFMWSDCMKFCIEMLEKCGAIVLLDGWKFSVGSTIEHAWAKKLGINIYYSVDEIPPF